MIIESPEGYQIDNGPYLKKSDGWTRYHAEFIVDMHNPSEEDLKSKYDEGYQMCKEELDY